MWVALPAAAAEYTYVPQGDFGRRACATVAAGGDWRDAGFDDRAWATVAPDPDAGAPWVAAGYARWRFDAGPEREVTILFDTDLPTLGEIRWGTGGEPSGARREGSREAVPSGLPPVQESYDKVLTDAPAQTHHALRLRNLTAGTAYHYRVVV